MQHCWLASPLFLCECISGALYILRKALSSTTQSGERSPKKLECLEHRLKLTYLCNWSHTQTRKIYDDTATESFPGLRKVSETHSGTTRTQACTSRGRAPCEHVGTALSPGESTLGWRNFRARALQASTLPNVCVREQREGWKREVGGAHCTG